MRGVSIQGILSRSTMVAGLELSIVAGFSRKYGLFVVSLREEEFYIPANPRGSTTRHWSLAG